MDRTLKKPTMNIIERVKNLIISPDKEWDAIKQEDKNVMQVFTTFVVPMLIIPCAAVFIGLSFVGYKVIFFTVKGVEFGIRYAIVLGAVQIITYFAGTYILDALTTTFKGQRNVNRSAQLVGFSMTAVFVAGIFLVIPSLYALTLLGSLYAFYIMFTGLPKLLQPAEDQKLAFFVLSVFILGIVYYASLELLTRLIFQMGGSMHM